MFLELQSNHVFRKNYFDMLKYRLAYGSLQLEGIDDDVANINQSMQIFNQLQAINFIFDKTKLHAANKDITTIVFVSNLNFLMFSK